MAQRGRPKGSSVPLRRRFTVARRKLLACAEQDEELTGVAVEAVEQARRDQESLSVPMLLEQPPARLTHTQLARLLWTTDYVELLLMELRQNHHVAVRFMSIVESLSHPPHMHCKVIVCVCAGCRVCARRQPENRTAEAERSECQQLDAACCGHVWRSRT